MTPVSAADRESADDRFLAHCLKAYRKDKNKASSHHHLTITLNTGKLTCQNRWI